jgi:hypothetical protein
VPKEGQQPIPPATNENARAPSPRVPEAAIHPNPSDKEPIRPPPGAITGTHTAATQNSQDQVFSTTHSEQRVNHAAIPVSSMLTNHVPSTSNLHKLVSPTPMPPSSGPPYGHSPANNSNTSGPSRSENHQLCHSSKGAAYKTGQEPQDTMTNLPLNAQIAKTQHLAARSPGMM